MRKIENAFHKIFRFVFTLGPFVMIGMACHQMYLENGLDGVIMVFKALGVMAIFLGFMFGVCYQVHQSDKEKLVQ